MTDRIYRIGITFKDGHTPNCYHLSLHVPKFSERFVCVAPKGTDSDVFYNIDDIATVEVEPYVEPR